MTSFINNVEEDLPVSGLVPAGDGMHMLRNVQATPGLGQAYAFSLVLPDDWKMLATPVRRGTVLIGDKFTGIGVFSPFDPPLPPVLLSIGTSALAAGYSILEHFRYHCMSEGYEVLVERYQEYAVGMVVEGLAIQQSPVVGPIKMRVAIFEDGGRLFALAGMAPLQLYPEYVRTLSLSMLSFEFLSPQGQSFPLSRG